MKYDTKAKIKLVIKINNAKNRVSECFKLGTLKKSIFKSDGYAIFEQ